MSLTSKLDLLVDPGTYAGGDKPKIRWGQLIRESASIMREQNILYQRGSLVDLGRLGTIRGGVVTRANAYFLVHEIQFDHIPARMKVTRGDLKRIAVIADGLEVLTKIEREFLKPVIKGPESLESAFSIKRSDLRLFDVEEDRKELQKRHANGAVAYLRRGETVNFKTSEDDLKGGIPALRSQVKNRKPFWYCIQGDQNRRTRIVFPEHIDKRYVFTLVEKSDASVVIDKLYLLEPLNSSDAQLIHASLNTLFSWYQVELRGRSQMGEGVLELKIPDYSGLVVANPDKVSDAKRKKLFDAFAELDNPGSRPSFEELGTAGRLKFDRIYAEICGFTHPEEMLVSLEQELRALAGERSERRLSVSDAKVSRRKLTNVAASIDAYAARLAASIEPHPDPRTFVPERAKLESVPILGDVTGHLDIGTELFNQGEVLASGNCVARAGSVLAAQFVRGVLLVQPDLAEVRVPTKGNLSSSVEDWTREGRRWQARFKDAASKALIGIDDSRTRLLIEQRALKLLHAL